MLRESGCETAATACQLCSLTLWNTMEKKTPIFFPSKSFMCWKSLPLRMQLIGFSHGQTSVAFQLAIKALGIKGLVQGFFFLYSCPNPRLLFLFVHAVDGGACGHRAAEGYQGLILNAR